MATNDPVQAQVAGSALEGIEGLAGANVIVLNLDDPARVQFGQYDDYNNWPEDFPYPSMPWMDKLRDNGVRFSRARMAGRCVPTRACNLTGRQPHVSTAHPHGQLHGNIPQQGGLTEDYPEITGVLGSMNPWPKVAKDAGAAHAMLHVGKLHASNWKLVGGDAIEQNENQIVNEVGFDYAYKTRINTDAHGNAQEPYRGYVNFYATQVDGLGATTDVSPGGDPTQQNPYSAAGHYMLTWEWEQITSWLTTQFAGPSGDATPFVVHWWTNAPHGILPAIDPTGLGPDLGSGRIDLTRGGETFATQIPWAKDSVGGVNATFSPGGLFGPGYDESGLLGGPGNTYFPSSGSDHLRFGAQGCANTLFRRMSAQLESIDRIMEALDTWLHDNHHEAWKKTVWVVLTDNGASESDITPQADYRYGAARGPEYGDGLNSGTIPPTSDGHPTGTPFHPPEETKNTIFEGGVAVPFLVWSPMLPEHMHGADSYALMDSTDFYPTVLDILCGKDQWKSALSADELAKVDGVSLYDDLLGIGAGARDYALTQVYIPAAAPEGNLTMIRRAVYNRAEWKLMRNYEVGVVDEWRLHDLKEDRTELDANNRYANANLDPSAPLYDAEAAEQLADLRAKYLELVGNLD